MWLSQLTVNRKIQACIVTNFMLLGFVICIISKFADSETLRYGYSKELVVLGVTVDSLDKYICLHLVIFFVEFFHAIVYEYANPICYFQVFNDQKKYITDFTKFELQFYSQSLWFLTSVKSGFMLLVSIVQIDITIAKIVYAEIAVMIVIRNILNGKIFVKDQPQQAIVEEIVIDSST
jgi:hypothetical protein